MSSWLEYQLLTLTLGGFMVLALVLTELLMRRYQVLPLLFSGMFTIRSRRLYCFECDITDSSLGLGVGHSCRLTLRMVILLVCSYLWQFTVLESETVSGETFPQKQCNLGFDCFTSDVTFNTVITR
jgi:hypothetical protein